MYHVINSGTEFSGLKITSGMMMGCQLLESEGGANNFPEYQFILLDGQNNIQCAYEDLCVCGGWYEYCISFQLQFINWH